MTDIIARRRPSRPAGRRARDPRQPRRPPSRAVAGRSPGCRPLARVVVACWSASSCYFAGWWGLFIVVGLRRVDLPARARPLPHGQAGRHEGHRVLHRLRPRSCSRSAGARPSTASRPSPLGAYVRIIGMNNLEEVEPDDEARTYREKSYWARLAGGAGRAGHEPGASPSCCSWWSFIGLRRSPATRTGRWPRSSPGSAAAAAPALHTGDQLDQRRRPAGGRLLDHLHRDRAAPRRPSGRPGGRSRRRSASRSRPPWAGSSTPPAAAQLDPHRGRRQDRLGQRRARSTTTPQTRQQLADAPKGDATRRVRAQRLHLRHHRARRRSACRPTGPPASWASRRRPAPSTWVRSRR